MADMTSLHQLPDMVCTDKKMMLKIEAVSSVLNINPQKIKCLIDTARQEGRDILTNSQDLVNECFSRGLDRSDGPGQLQDDVRHCEESSSTNVLPNMSDIDDVDSATFAGQHLSAITNVASTESKVTPSTVTRLLQKEQEMLRQMKSCIRCQHERNTLFLPCGHFIMCSLCTEKITICPMCEERIIATSRTILS